MNDRVTSTTAPDHAPVSLEQARSMLLARVEPTARREALPLGQCSGRVLAEDVLAAIDVPGFDNSAMDGYALAQPESGPQRRRFRLTQRIAAGQSGEALAPGQAARIFTGAPVPPGTTAVVRQEDARLCGAEIEVESAPGAGENIRRRGHDIASGQPLLARGERLGPQHIALAAATGLERLVLFGRLRVGTFVTGDELVEPGTALGPGQIYNSNRYALMTLLAGLGCEVQDAGNVPDRLDATCEALASLAAGCDLLLTTGGVSVGEADYVKPAIERLGGLGLWRVAMRPGKPVAFGNVHGTPFLGLPGNPVAVFVTFLLLARPVLLRMQGVREVFPRSYPVTAGFAWPQGCERREFLRVRLDDGPEGPVARLFDRQGSSVISSTVWADGLVEVPPGGRVLPGDRVGYLPFAGLLG